MTDAPCKHQAEAHHLRAGIKLLADTVRSWGWVSRRQESNGEIVGRALHEMQSRIELLESALDFYTCVDHYPVHGAESPGVVREDGGARARAALRR